MSRRRTRLLSTSDCSVSGSASATCSAASSVQPPANTRSARKSRCSCSSEQLVAPLDRGPQRLLARIGVAAALEQVEPLRRAARGAGSGVKTTVSARPRARAPSGSCRAARRAPRPWPSAPGARRRPQHGRRTAPPPRRSASGGHRVRPLAVRAQPLAARDERPSARRRRSGETPSPPARAADARHCRAGRAAASLEPLAEDVDQSAARLLLHVERVRDGARDERGIVERRERDPEDPVLEAVTRLGRRLERQPRLARSRRGRSASPAAPPRSEAAPTTSAELALAAEERLAGARQVRAIERLQRREARPAPSW